MELLTNRKVEIQSNLDGTNAESVKAFQKWFNLNYVRPPFTNKPLAVDGVYGTMTKKAYAVYGNLFESKQPKKNETPQTTDDSTDILPEELSTTKKTLIIIGGVVVVSLLVYILVPKKSK